MLYKQQKKHQQGKVCTKYMKTEKKPPHHLEESQDFENEAEILKEFGLMCTVLYDFSPKSTFYHVLFEMPDSLLLFVKCKCYHALPKVPSRPMAFQKSICFHTLLLKSQT